MTSGTEPSTKFLILGQPRSGSTLLVSLLNSHPEIYCDGEILQERILFPMLFIKGRASLGERKFYGFKLLTYQLISVQKLKKPKEFIMNLSNIGFKIIFQLRRNTLRQQVSNLYAHQTGVFHKRNELNHSKRIVLDIDLLLRWLASSKKLRQLEYELLSDIHHISISYEDDLENPISHQETVNRICSFLDINSSKVKSDLVKVTPQKYEDFIENIEEFRERIEKTEFSNFLDQE